MDNNLSKWVENTDLETRLKYFNDFYFQIATGLLNFHTLSLTHNDLKTDNILVSKIMNLNYVILVFHYVKN